VEALMALAVDKLNALREDKDGVLRRYQVRVRMMGDLDRLPPDVRAAAAQLELATAGHRLAALNVCFAYTGRHDMLQAMHAVQVRGSPSTLRPPLRARRLSRAALVAIRHDSKPSPGSAMGWTVQEGVANGSLCSSDVTLSLLEASLYTGDCPPVGLLIRTSGETRLSDFMSMQCADAALVFLSVLWPDFSFWHLVWALWLYQRAHPALRDTDGKAHPRDWAGLAPPPVDCTRGDMCMCSGGVPTHHVGLAKQQVAVNLCADDQDVALGLPVRDEGDRLVRLHAGQLIRRVRVGEMSGGRTHGDRLAEVDAGQLRNGRPTGSWGPNGMQHAQQRRVEKFLQRRLEDRWAWLHRMLPAS
jgi:undecaprenyl pyrophosphate synthase